MSDRFAIPICRHLKTNGIRCQSPALNGETFCYFHLRLHKEQHRPLSAREIVERRNLLYSEYEEAVLKSGEDPMMIACAYPIQNEFQFPPLEDAESIQVATSMLFHALAQGQVYLSRARLLRDLLRVATISCRLNKPNPEAATAAVGDIDHTAEGLAIAPEDLPSQPADSATVQSSVAEPEQPDTLEPPQQTAEKLESLIAGDFSSDICQLEPPQQTPEELEPLIGRDSIGRDFSPDAFRNAPTGSNGASAPETCFSEAHEFAACAAPELPQSGPQPTPNCNYLSNNILPDTSAVSPANGRF